MLHGVSLLTVSTGLFFSDSATLTAHLPNLILEFGLNENGITSDFELFDLLLTVLLLFLSFGPFVF